jgi:hypothetical protein
MWFATCSINWTVVTIERRSLTSKLKFSTLSMMIGKKRYLLLMIASVLLLQFADCMAAFSQDQQTMQCCRTPACTPANQSNGCCTAMTSAELPRMLVKARITLDVPTPVVFEPALVLETAVLTPLISSAFEPQQYSLPELYTLHNSLLI